MLLLAALLVAQAPAGEPTLKPSASGDIASAVGDCWRAVGEQGVDVRRLAGGGWSAVPVDTADPSPNPLDAYTKAGANHRIMVPRAADKRSVCAVIARVFSPSEGGATLTAIQKSLLVIEPKVRLMRAADGIVFVSEPYFALVDELDSDHVTKEQPGLRIVVGYRNAEKK
jgi:hypothetical protein